MKTILTFLLALTSLTSWANMASPIEPGTWTSSPFLNEYVDISEEKIQIVLGKSFSTAEFKIEYHIFAQQEGSQVPLLFYASEFKRDFKIWLDDQEIQLTKVPRAYESLSGTPFQSFSYFFQSESWSEVQQVELARDSSSGYFVRIDDLKFFEADLSQGQHIIRVEYIADHWVDLRDWVKQPSFRYALSPAKYWKSFGNLEITLDASQFEGKLKTNLGKPMQGDLETKASWSFSSLPKDELHIIHQPEINRTANILIKISPWGIASIVGLSLALLHLFLMRAYRRAKPLKKFSWVAALGNVFVPFLFLASYLYSFELIGSLLGDLASNYNGYVFLVIFTYPLILLLYWLLMWLVDKKLLKKTAVTE